jgi:hypothetical protein
MSAPDDPPSAPKWWRRVRARYTPKQLTGAGLMAGAFVVTAGLAFWGSSDKPPNLAEGLALTLAAGAMQISAGWLFSHGQGTAQSDHAVSSVVNLLRLLARVLVLRADVEKSVRKKSLGEPELRRELGQVSAQLDMIGERADDAVGHWKQFYPDAVDRARQAELEGRSD